MGKSKYIKSPERMRELFEGYKKENNESSKWEKIQYVGKDGQRVKDALKPPLTYEGFKIYCRIHASDVHHYFENTDKRYEDYRDVCRAIKEEIREDQIIGGMLNFYNPSITQRLNNLTEKVDTNTTLNVDKVPSWMRPKD